MLSRDAGPVKISESILPAISIPMPYISRNTPPALFTLGGYFYAFRGCYTYDYTKNIYLFKTSILCSDLRTKHRNPRLYTLTAVREYTQ